MQKFLTLIFFLCATTFALNVPEPRLLESLNEEKRGNTFLQLIWNTDSVITDIEMTIYLKKLGHELVQHSKNPAKHFEFLLLNNDNINAFAGPYGYIGVNTGLLLASDSESELAGVLAHEIAHVTQNHLNRFNQKTDKQSYLILAGLLLAALTKGDTSEAIVASTIAGTAQKNINFTREHEWEADRIAVLILKKSGFNPQKMADFFKKLKDEPGAKEFLRSHPLSINRASDSLQRTARDSGNYKKNSFAYQTIRAKLYYQKYGFIKAEKETEIGHYMQAYHAFEREKYQEAKEHIDKLLTLNKNQPSVILAGRIYAKLGDIERAQEFFLQNNRLKKDEISVYYAAKTYADNQKIQKAVAILKPFLRKNSACYQSYQLLSSLFVRQGLFDRAHIESAKALIVRGDLDQAIKHYERAKSITSSQDLHDILNVKIRDLQQILDLYKNLP